ncbi:MAG TPA: ABC transporter permease [Blastocatellia bacterium]|nr:ABC transporter permease [Blastocatellia bacterium]
MITDFAVRDSRFAIRMLLKRPAFTAMAVLTLALGIGANTALFSVVNAVLLRPLPFAHPEQLVLVSDELTGRQLKNVGMSVNELQDFQERSGVFEEISAVWPVDANLTGSDRPERIELMAVSPNYFSLLGARAQIGRVLGDEDRAQGFAEGVVISDGLWRRLFGADPNVLGKKIRADSDMYTIVGVMPPDFRHPGRTLRDDTDMWGTAGFSANPFGPPRRSVRMLPGAIGRLKPDLTVEQAQMKLDAYVSQLTSEFPNEYPAEAGWTVRLMPARETLVGEVRPTLLVLLGAVGVVLLIACVNIANLMLARSLARQREMAIRLALGASRSRLVLQLLNESFVLSLLGGGVALLFVSWGTDLLLRLVPATIPRLHEVGFDSSVLLFTFLLSLLTGVLFGLVPAMQASRPDVLGGLKEGTAGAGHGARSNRLRGLLVVVEFALSLVLMIGAGLLLRSFWRLIDVHPGFNSENVLVARIWLPVPNNPELDPYRPPAKRAQFVKEVLRRASALPGVEYAAMGGGNGVPLIGVHNTAGFVIEDRADESVPPQVQVSSVSPDYFSALGTPLVDGRFFSDVDDTESPRVVLIDQAMVERFWPGENPVGKHIKFGRRDSKAPWGSVVGVVGNIKTDGFDVPDQPHVYLPIAQNPGYAMAIYLKSNSDPTSLTRALRNEVAAVDPDLPVFGERTMADVVAASLAQRRFAMQLVTIFGVVALILAGVGIYGVMAYAVNQRTREIGIRLALGANTRDIMRWVLKQGMGLTMAGVIAGLGAAVAATRLLGGLLFGVAPTDPVTFAALAALLAVVALIACYVPARRATRVDPIVALRYE